MNEETTAIVRPVETTAVDQVQSGGLATLALMSEQEFEQNLARLALAQDRIRRIHQTLMVEGVDYGLIPGTQKPTLMQPGAEKLLVFYKLVPRLGHSPERPCANAWRAPWRQLPCSGAWVRLSRSSQFSGSTARSAGCRPGSAPSAPLPPWRRCRCSRGYWRRPAGRDQKVKADKPLGIKAYGSIPHLPNSRLGPGDYHCHDGQARIATERVRDARDRVYVEEKLDGSCVAVARLQNGELVALGRAGYPAKSSPYEMHHLFDAWVKRHVGQFEALLGMGERLVGEWLAQAHGTRYDLRGRSPFVAFDLMAGGVRVPRSEFWGRVLKHGFEVPELLFQEPTSVGAVVEVLDGGGYYGALDPVEGAVWRVERDGQVDFLAKWVRPDKIDGCYLPDVSGAAAVWNVGRPE